MMDTRSMLVGHLVFVKPNQHWKMGLYVCFLFIFLIQDMHLSLCLFYRSSLSITYRKSRQCVCRQTRKDISRNEDYKACRWYYVFQCWKWWVDYIYLCFEINFQIKSLICFFLSLDLIFNIYNNRSKRVKIFDWMSLRFIYTFTHLRHIFSSWFTHCQ
jgi:hypothetical protein